MSALARLYLHDKAVVSGSDMRETDNTRRLAEAGAAVRYEQAPENITDDIELVVYTEAMPHDHPELAAARAKKIETINYFEALARFANEYYLIAVSGTHGKTTTTAMLIDVFEACEKDPTGFVGSLRAKTKSNFRPGKSKYAIVEACEYKRDFLHLKPDVLVILNLELEHIDFYHSLDEVIATFKEFVGQVNDGGVVVANLQDMNVKAAVEGAAVKVMNFMEQLDLQLPMQQPGMHNRFNAAAALTVAKHEKLDMEKVKQAVSEFAGTWRRFEYKGEMNGAKIYDDYGHHPTEVAATIAGARELYPDKKLTVVFQPHTYSRTKGFFNEFAKSFKGADRLFLLPIYAAREEENKNVSSRELAVRALEYCRDSRYVESLEQAEAVIRAEVGADEVVLVMGAGDITSLATSLTK